MTHSVKTRVVLDTNTVISGLISPNGPPRLLLDWAREQRYTWFSSPALLEELLDVLSREKFSKRLAQAGLTTQGIVAELKGIAHIVLPTTIPRVIEQDPDDDQVIACAVEATADMIVSGDKHLQNLGRDYQGIRIMTAAQAVVIIGGS